MKTTIKSLLALLSVGMIATVPLLRAQDNSTAAAPAADAPAPAAAPAPDAAAPDNPPPPKKKGGRRGAMNIDQLKERLNLTDDQVAKIDPILKDSREKGMAIRQDTSLSDDDKRSKAQALMKDSHDQIRALLTPDQQTTFDSMSRRGGKKKKGGDAEAPPPAPGDAPAPTPPPAN